MGVILALSACLQEDPRALVERLASESIEEREAAVGELRRMAGPAEKEVERAARHSDPEVALRARQILGFWKRRDIFPASLETKRPEVAQAMDRNELTRIQGFLLAAKYALEHPGEVPPEELDRCGATALREADPEAKPDVVHFLARCGSRAAVPALVEMLEQDTRNALEALNYLRKLGAAEAVPAIARRTARDPGCLMAGLSALRALGLPEAIPEFIRLLDDPSPAVRERAVDLLGEYGASEAVAALAARLRDGEPNVRGAAARALGRLKATEAVPRLIELLRDADRDARRSAMRALERLRVPSAAGEILKLLEDPEVLVRQDAVHRLAGLGAREAIPAVVKLLGDRALRQSAIYALGALEAREAAPALREFLRDADPYVRRQAALALRQMGLEEADK